MYQALYRKWRPQTFDQVIGQKHITETLKNQIKTGRLSHAYLFIGTRGTGKTTCARILAKAVNCESPVNGNPCGHCAACRAISEGSVLDIVELDAASNNGVDNVRALREEAVFSPATVKKRVYIIDEVHMLSGAAFNALLKILEEPPAHLMFILATTELHKVPATILSRCQRHSFKRIEAPVIASHLENVAAGEGFKLDRSAAELIARLAEGGVRDAISLLDQCSAAEKIDVEAVYSAMGLAGNRRTVKLLELIVSHDTEAALEEFDSMWMDGKDPGTVLAELSGLMRDILVLLVAPKGGAALLNGNFDMDALSGFARRMSREELLYGMETVQKAQFTAKEAGNPKTVAELCLVSLCDNAAAESIGSLRARISRLEQQIKNAPVSRHEATAEEYYEAEDCCEEERFAGREEPFEELDPEDYSEEQPEDAFVERNRELTQQELAQKRISDGELWSGICDKASPTLRMDVKLRLHDTATVRAAVKGDALCIEVAPGFTYNSFNRQDVLQSFAQAAREVSGRELRVQLMELKPQERVQRSLDELRVHKEVKFIN